jgi:hypothetical protein
LRPGGADEAVRVVNFSGCVEDVIDAFSRRRWRIGSGVAAALLISAAAVAPASQVAVGPELQANTYTTSDQDSPAVGAAWDGAFVVTWESFLQDGSREGVFARRFSSSGGAAGAEFQVNEFTTDLQRDPRIALDHEGNFVVAWQSNPYVRNDTTAQDGDNAGVFARRFASDGSPRGTEFQVNTYTTGDQEHPDVASAENGNFVVVWGSAPTLGNPASSGQDGFSSGVYAQRFTSDGTPSGTEFRVNTYTNSAQTYPRVAADAPGNFVVVWRSNQGGDDFGIFAQRFASNGSTLGTEFHVNTYTTGLQERPAIDADAAGNFVITWQSDQQDGGSRGVFAQRYGSDGLAAGTEFQVNTYTTSYQGFPDVALNDAAEFTIVWQSFDQGADGFDIFAKRYSSDGTPECEETRINFFTQRLQRNGAVAPRSMDQFTIAWDSQALDRDRTEVRLRGFGPGQSAMAPLLSPAAMLCLAVLIGAGGYLSLRRRCA